MNVQKNTNLFKNKTLIHDKNSRSLKFLSSIYSDCHPTYGDFNDKEDIN